MLSGIAGEIAFRGTRANTAPVEHMITALPVDTGQNHNVWHNGWAVLGQAPRKNISRAEAASQPTYDAEHDVALVFDGRLTNRDKLHTQLADEYRFSTVTDAEVILAARSEERRVGKGAGSRMCTEN